MVIWSKTFVGNNDIQCFVKFMLQYKIINSLNKYIK
jgi:hypothetical protein